MRMPASLCVLVKAKLVNCEPWTPFCLSSGDAGLVDLLLPLRDEREHLASEVALEGTNGIELGMSLGDALRHQAFVFGSVRRRPMAMM